MSDTVISVENLSKSYLIGHAGPQERYHSLRDTLVRHGKNYVRKAIDMARGRQIIQGDSVEEFWALKDVSFEVKRGEVMGIIGRNGAGKSTLLKVLSRITEPTSGRVVLDGRVASLLEVGTGFHPELTGRENIFLNGAILGMGKVEIKKKFDEIVDFAGVEKFLDTPVKRYSSGMYVRLAFAVAAYLEPEILIIDEVLAVGDAEFQKKCLGKMQDVAKGGRTVLFVSHNMAAVTALCDTAIVMTNGQIHSHGNASLMVQSYQGGTVAEVPMPGSPNLKYFELRECNLYNSGGGPISTFSAMTIFLKYASKAGSFLQPDVYFAIRSKDGVLLMGCQSSDISTCENAGKDGTATLEFHIGSLPLMPGTYNVEIELKDVGRQQWEFIPQPYILDVACSPVYGTKEVMPWHGMVASKVSASWIDSP